MSDDNRYENAHDVHQRVSFGEKMEELNNKLIQKKHSFFELSEEVFDVNQEMLSKNDELKSLRGKYKRNHVSYLDAMTEMALKEADLQFRKESIHETNGIIENFALESNSDVESYRSELKYALQKYQDSRRTAKKLQSDFSKLSDSARVQSLNFLAFCKYSQSAQMNEIIKLSVSNELPSKKEINVCDKEFEKCASNSRKELAAFYKLKIHEFQKEERIQIGKSRTAMERNMARLNGTEYQENANLASNIDHHLQVNSLENRVAQKLVMEAHAQFKSGDQADSSRRGSFSEQESVRGRLRKQGSAADGGGGGFGEDSVESQVRASTASGRLPGSGRGKSMHLISSNHSGESVKRTPKRPPSGPIPSYLQPTRAQTPQPPPKRPQSSSTGRNSSSASKAVPAQYRAQLSELYHSKKKAASAIHELHTARTKSVFDQRQFRTAPLPDSPLLSECLLDSDIMDPTTSANLIQNESGEYVDQGQALGELMAQLSAAEGKFRQLSAIKEGLDMQLVKQSHLMMLIARDLQADIESKTKTSGVHMSYPAPVSLSGNVALKVQDRALIKAFAPPALSTARSNGNLTAGGAISNKYRFRIDPSATNAAPFVPLTEIKESYEEGERHIRKCLADAAEVLNVPH